MRLIATKPPKETKTISPADKQDNYYRGFRSAVVLFWMFSNLGLAAVVLNTSSGGGVQVADPQTSRSTIYMAVVLWSVAALSLFRFVGAMWFLVVRMVSLSFVHDPFQSAGLIKY